jgi:hypothetical protein
MHFAATFYLAIVGRDIFRTKRSFPDPTNLQSIVPALHAQFRDKTVRKRYLALVAGVPRWEKRYVLDQDGWTVVDAPIGRDPEQQ